MAVITNISIIMKKCQYAAFLAPVFIPAIHILVLDKFWSDFNVNVNKEHCTCSCWDTVFKGIKVNIYLSNRHIYLLL